MITKFNKLLESRIDIMDIETNIDNENELIKKIKQELSIIAYKKKNSPKPIRIKKINGYFDKKDLTNIDLISKTLLKINFSNNDIITGKLFIYKNDELNNIVIKINEEVIYDLDNKDFNNEILVDKLIYKYKEYLLKNHKSIK